MNEPTKISREKSLLEAIRNKDKKLIKEIEEKAKKGEIVRLI